MRDVSPVRYKYTKENYGNNKVCATPSSPVHCAREDGGDEKMQKYVLFRGSVSFSPESENTEENRLTKRMNRLVGHVGYDDLEGRGWPQLESTLKMTAQLSAEVGGTMWVVKVSTCSYTNSKVVRASPNRFKTTQLLTPLPLAPTQLPCPIHTIHPHLLVYVPMSGSPALPRQCHEYAEPR